MSKISTDTNIAGTVEGDVAPGFENVRDVFANNFKDDEEVGASFSVFRDGKFLVNLWGGHADAGKTKAWKHDTLPNVWSTTKAVGALCIALLVERGQISYDDKVADHWPEFSAHGKGALTVGQLLSHQSGLSGLREQTSQEDLYNHDLMAARMAAAEPLWAPGTQAGYHPLTFAYPVAELVKRITGKSIGRFFQDEIARPFDIDFFIGLPESEEPRIAEMVESKTEIDFAGREFSDVQITTFISPTLSPTYPNERAWRAAEIASANGRGSASALAKLFGIVVSSVSEDERPLITSKTRDALAAEQITGEDLIQQQAMSWGAGVMRNTVNPLFGPNPASFGHTGWGGSFVLCDPTNRLGIAYTMNQMGLPVPADPRAQSLLAAFYEALG